MRVFVIAILIITAAMVLGCNSKTDTGNTQIIYPQQSPPDKVEPEPSPTAEPVTGATESCGDPSVRCQAIVTGTQCLDGYTYNAATKQCDELVIGLVPPTITPEPLTDFIPDFCSGYSMETCFGTTVCGDALCDQEESCTSDCSNSKRIALVVDAEFYADSTIREKISRYAKSNPEYRFETIVYHHESTQPPTLDVTGGFIKKNLLEVRNTLKNQDSLVGIILIGNIRPTIWRDETLWLGTGGFYPSLYPLVAFGDHYTSFDVSKEGFTERVGATTGSEIGGGYNANIWGAAIIPPTFSVNEGKKLVSEYFDRNHEYRSGKKTYSGVLYANHWGCHSNLQSEVEKVWGDVEWLCPNTHSSLNGFYSLYTVYIHGQGPSVTFVGSAHSTQTAEEEEEYATWINNLPISSGSLTPYGSPNEYSFLLTIRRDETPDEIRQTIKNNLPHLLCSRTSCDVLVSEMGYTEMDGSAFSATWQTYGTQAAAWDQLYASKLATNSYQLTHVTAHGSPESHAFGISGDSVKNGQFHSLVYAFESCSTAQYTKQQYIAGEYLFAGDALVVSAYSIPVAMTWVDSIPSESAVSGRFIAFRNGAPAHVLFLKNYSNSILLGDPLLTLS